MKSREHQVPAAATMAAALHAYPFVSLPAALVVLRVAVAVFFMAHAAVRIVNDSIPGFGGFLENRSVGEHGTGGSEASVSLMVSLLVVAAAERDRRLDCASLAAVPFFPGVEAKHQESS